MAASYAKPEAASWTVLIPEQATVLDDVTVTNDWIVTQDREDVLSRLSVYDKDGKRIRELPLPVFGNVTESSYDYGTDTIYATLASHTAPYKVYSMGGKALDWNLVWQDDPPLDLSQIVAERVYVPAKDGTKIPVFIARRKDSKLDGANPTLLNGYGGFNISVAPFYLGSYSSFINRGGILVDAGIRGGSEYGERWHEQAMFGRKQTTFDDMIAVAEWLIAQKYTQPSKLAVAGGSNGGLTVGRVITQRPDLSRGDCQVPLLGMVRFHKFLIARYWIAEYGDPDSSRRVPLIPPLLAVPGVRRGTFPETLVVKSIPALTRCMRRNSLPWCRTIQGRFRRFCCTWIDSGHGSGKTTSSA
jgi:prolyl oligopeptidase